MMIKLVRLVIYKKESQKLEVQRIPVYLQGEPAQVVAHSKSAEEQVRRNRG